MRYPNHVLLFQVIAHLEKFQNRAQDQTMELPVDKLQYANEFVYCFSFLVIDEMQYYMRRLLHNLKVRQVWL